MARSRNPIGFTPLPVTFFTTAIYIALFAVLLVVHHIVPSAPKSAVPKNWNGVNITEAWLDLKELSKSYHPYNSKANVEVRGWLLQRLSEILDSNGADWRTHAENVTGSKSVYGTAASSHAVTVFDDRISNVTTFGSLPWNSSAPQASYVEGDNVMVYIRGSEDDQSNWWTLGSKHEGPGGVLVNAHYDSVSTGYGATDDGVGVVSVLQLVSHFTKEGNQPKKGILALLNNGEEDGLYGAYAFTQHPISRFPTTFLNLEGAGAGGRATLFRSTDAEVTKFYASSKYPFGSVISGDGFKRGFVKSGTDYSVFTEELRLRGLDVAFMAPRARYHTSQDDARDTSVESLWHMLSASLETVKGLSDDTSSTFEASPDEDNEGSTGVWFDVLGRVFAVMQLHTLFALSVTLLVAGPIILILLEVFIQKTDKWYPFSWKRYLHSSDDDEPVQLYGLRGFFRFPFAFVIASAGVAALAFLITKVNPYVLYSSEYAVWTMMLTAWLSVAWFVLRLGDSVRPSALSRLFTLFWLYVLAWIALVLVTLGEQRMDISSGYFIVIYNAAIFVALLISYLELFALPKKNVYVEHTIYGPGADSPSRAGSIANSHTDDRPASRGAPSTTNANENDDANERTSLLNSSPRQTFTRYGGAHSSRRRASDAEEPLIQDPLLTRAYEGEQAWSSSLPGWTWLLQFLILGPINIILVGQIALLVTSALHQTPADGNSILTIYVIMATLSMLLMLPLTPFLHRVKWQIPTLLFFVFAGTLVYNLTAFPFSRDARLKVYFVQRVDLETSTNQVAIVGVDGFVESIVNTLPSAAMGGIDCRANNDKKALDWAKRDGLSSCVFNGLSPNVVPLGYGKKHSGAPYPNTTFALRNPRDGRDAEVFATKSEDPIKWIDFTATRPGNGTNITIEIQGLNTRACRVYFDEPVYNITVHALGETPSSRAPATVPSQRRAEKDDPKPRSLVKLWSRTWDGKWHVTAASAAAPHNDPDTAENGSSSHAPVKGIVACQWADANVQGVIPAFDEVKRFIPVWSAVSKHNDGLVEGFKRFEI